MPRTPADLTERARDFLAERIVGTLTTLRADGSPHVVAVGFTYDSDTGCARVITSDGNQKARNAERGMRAAVTQVDGARWITLEGVSSLHRESAAVADAVERYSRRYRVPRENPRRVVVEIHIDRVLGARSLFDGE